MLKFYKVVNHAIKIKTTKFQQKLSNFSHTTLKIGYGVKYSGPPCTSVNAGDDFETKLFMSNDNFWPVSYFSREFVCDSWECKLEVPRSGLPTEQGTKKCLARSKIEEGVKNPNSIKLQP